MAKSQINSDVAKWVSLAECWLKKRFVFALEEVTPFEAMMKKS
jgi:hypothetical protein